VTERRGEGYDRRAWRRFRQNRVAVAALLVLLLIAGFALGAGLISRYVTGFTPSENHLADKLKPPFTGGYLLGSDGNGRDVLTRLAYGGRVSLLVALLAAAAATVGGTAVGLAAGYAGRWVDAVLMRLVDVLLCIPTLPLLILVAALFRPGPVGLALVLAAVSWPGIARIVRHGTLSLRGREYVEAARALGASAPAILGRHVLPNVAPLAIVAASLAVPELMLAEAALSFLGLGVQVPTPSWGNMLGEGQRFFRTLPSGVLIPGLMIYLTSLSLFLVGNGVRDAFDPRSSR